MAYPTSDDYTGTGAFVADRGTGTVSGGRLRASATSTVVCVGNTGNVDVADQFSETVVATLGTTTSEAGPYTRFLAGPTYYQAELTNLTGGTATVILYKYNGSFVNLVQATGVSVTLPATLRLTSIGTRHTVTLNGAVQLTYDDPELLHGTPGGYVFATTSTANAELESWNADLPAPIAAPYRVAVLGTNTVNSAGTTLSVTYSGSDKPQPGDTIVVWGSRDNVTNDPATGDSISATPGSESYTRVALAQPSGTSTANAGLVGVVHYATVVSAWAAGSNTITWTSPSVTARAMIAEWYRNLGPLRGTADTAGSTAGAPSVTTTDPVVGDSVLCGAMFEHAASSTITGDSDTTNGSWTAIYPQVAGGGTNLTGAKLTTQQKYVTATGNQTFNPTNSTTSNVDAVAIALTFQPPVGPPRGAIQPAWRRAPLRTLLTR